MSPSRLPLNGAGIEAKKDITLAMDWLWFHANGGIHEGTNPLSTEAYIDVYEAETGDSLLKYRWAVRRFPAAVRRYADTLKELRDKQTLVLNLTDQENLLAGFVFFLRSVAVPDTMDERVLGFVDLTVALSQDGHRYSGKLENLNRAAQRFAPSSFIRSLREALEEHEIVLASGGDRILHQTLASWVADVADRLDPLFRPRTVVGSLFALSENGERRLVERFLNIFQRMVVIEQGVKGRMKRTGFSRIPIDRAYIEAFETFVYAVTSHEELTPAAHAMIEGAFCVFESDDIAAFQPGTQIYDEHRLNIFMLLTALLSRRHIAENVKRGAAEHTRELLSGSESYEAVLTMLKRAVGFSDPPEPTPHGKRRPSPHPAQRRASLQRGSSARRLMRGTRRPVSASLRRPSRLS